MGDDDLLTDEYVADLLAKEAGDCSLKYSTMGMEAYTTSSSRPTNKLKPNTRFLRNIIKGTNRHNNALAAKELSESQARLKDLADAKEEKRKKYNPSASEIRGRQLGNIAALLSGKSGTGVGVSRKKRRRSEEEEEHEDDTPSAMRKARADEDARRVVDMEAASRRQREKSDKRRRSLERYSVTRSRGRKDEDEEDYSYSRRNSSSEDERRAGGESQKKKKRRRDRSRSRFRRYRHRSPTRKKRRDSTAEDNPRRTRHRHSEVADTPSTRSTQEDGGDADSDPPEDLIGPAPPPTVLPRGRGALSGSTGMDGRFTAGYDPRSDMQADGDQPESWDAAVEAFRSRAKMRQQGADRLRQAGFTEDEVKRWEKGGEKTIDDVQWAKKGEKRAWDQGKDVDQDDD